MDEIAQRPAAGHRAIFLDRDGTIIVERGYLGDPAGVALEQGVGNALARASKAGWRLIVVTNQSGLARGYFDRQSMMDVHAAMQAELAAHMVALDGIYVCPHAPGDECACRKPAIGLLREAARQHHVSLSASYMVGDKLSDLEAGRRAGCRSILVATGHGNASLQSALDNNYPVVTDLAAAIDLILLAPEADHPSAQ